MGDLVSPSKRDIVDRLRQRFEHYRLRDGEATHQQHYRTPNLYESQRQDTLVLSQRWHESKAKKQSKPNRPNKDVNSTQPVQQRLKRKLDTGSTPAAEGSSIRNCASDQCKFDDRSLSPPCKTAHTQQQPLPGQKHTSGSGSFTSGSTSSTSGGGSNTGNTQSHCVSVNIVQQINGGAPSNNVSSEIKINVQSTVHTSQCSNSSTSTEIKTSTNICKEEQGGGSQQQGSGNTYTRGGSNQANDNFGFDNVSELQEFLDALEKGDGNIGSDLLQDFHSKFDEESSQDSIPTDSTGNMQGDLIGQQSHNKYCSQASVSQGNYYNKSNASVAEGSHIQGDLSKSAPRQRAEGMYSADSFESHPGNASYGQMGAMSTASCMTSGYPSSPSGPSTPTGANIPPQMHAPLGESGPAAETLKQLAAQHQNIEYKNPYNNYGSDPYSAENYARRQGGYPGYGQMPGYMCAPQNGSYPYGHPMAAARMGYPQNAMNMGPNPYMARASGMTGPRMPGMGESFPSNKTMMHYGPNGSSTTSPTSSSLQQLQDQVRTQFSGGPTGPQMGPGAGAAPMGEMQFSQTQYMRMSHPNMQMSERMHFQSSGTPGAPGLHNISTAQHQSFNMPYGGNVPGGGMMPPMRGMAPGAGSPPADYETQMRMKMYQEKMLREQEARRMQQMQQHQQGGGTHPPPEYPSTPTSTTHPLQTMQNMVEQTSPNVSSSSQTSQPTPHQQPQQQHRPMFNMAGTVNTPPQATDMNMNNKAPQDAGSKPRHASMGAGIPTPVSVAPMAGATVAAPPGPKPRTPKTPQNATTPSTVNSPIPPFSTAQTTPTTTTPTLASQNSATVVASTSTATTLPQGTSGTDSNKSDSSTTGNQYTSALMRGQRPPNVNVGPEGLNISQPRMSGWHHPSTMAQGAHMMMGAGHMGSMHPGAQRMQYSGYQGAAAGMHVMPNTHAHMQMSQQQVMHMSRTMGMGGMGGGGGGVMMGQSMGAMQGGMGQGMGAGPGSAQGQQGHHSIGVISAQQQQHMHLHNGHSMASMSQVGAMRSGVPPGHPHAAPAYPPQRQQQNTPNYALDFLDSSHHGSNPDFPDPSMAGGGVPTSEYNFIDDILAGK